MLDLYKNIKNRRIALGMTQSELADKTGYSGKSMIAKVEKGIVDLPQSKIEEFAIALHTTPAELMGWIDDPQDENGYYSINKETREVAEWIHKNPDYKIIFDTSKEVKKEDIDFVVEMIERLTGKKNG